MSILKQFKYVCMGISMLSKKRYVHQDIKVENLVYNGKRLFLIDFGLMTRDPYADRYMLKQDYIVFPPEYKHYVYGKKCSSYVFKNFTNMNILGTIKSIYPEYKTDLENIRSYPHDKIDVYSLGIVLVILYKWSGVNNKQVEQLIRGMICFDPAKRWSAEAASQFISDKFYV